MLSQAEKGVVGRTGAVVQADAAHIHLGAIMTQRMHHDDD